MRKILCMLCVILVSTVAFGQAPDRPIDLLVGPESQGSKLEQLKENAVSEFQIRVTPVVEAVKLFDDDQVVPVATALAEALGLYVYPVEDKPGCIRVSDEAGLVFNVPVEGTKKFMGPCVWYVCNCGRHGSPSTCMTSCMYQNWAMFCSTDFAACCGCQWLLWDSFGCTDCIYVSGCGQ